MARHDRLRLLGAGRRAIAARLTRWGRPERPTERQLRAILSAEGLAPYAWGNPPGDVYAEHRHPFVKILYCVSGSIRFDLPEEDRALELGPGDRLELPARTLHAALVGPEGVVCLEAHANPPPASRSAGP